MQVKSTSLEPRPSQDEHSLLRSRCRRCRHLLHLVDLARMQMESALLSLQQPDVVAKECQQKVHAASLALIHMLDEFGDRGAFDFLVPHRPSGQPLSLDLSPSGLSCIGDAVAELFGLDVSATRWLVTRRRMWLSDRLRRVYARTDHCRDLLLEHRARWKARRMELRAGSRSAL